MQRPKLISRKVIARPEDYTPSHPNSVIVGTFNAPITLFKDSDNLERILAMVRVTEAHKRTRDKNIYLPYFEIPNEEGHHPQMGFDVFQRGQLEKIRRKEVKLDDGTDRLRHISLPRKMLLDLEGNVIERQQNPAIYPIWEYERFGIEDVRITHMEQGRYVGTYVCPHREEGVSTGLFETEDFQKYKRHQRQIIVGVKDVAVFPEKVPSPFETETIKKGQKIYAGLKRPGDFKTISPAGIWASYSSDLILWGMEHRLTRNKETTGTGAPPIRYKNLWIAPYHKTFKVEGQKNLGYKTRLFSVNAKEPWKDFKTSDDFLIRENYLDVLPKNGFVRPVVYTIGIVEHDGISILSSGIDDKWDVIDAFYTEDLAKFIDRSN